MMQLPATLGRVIKAICLGLGLLLAGLAVLSFLASPAPVLAHFPALFQQLEPLTKTVSALEVLPGDLLTFTLGVNTQEPTRLIDYIPDGTKFYRAYSTDATLVYDASNNTILSTSNRPRVVTLVVRVLPGLPEGRVIRNWAQLFKSDSTTPIQEASSTTVIRRYYVPRHIVISGPRTEIDELLPKLDPRLPLELVKFIDLGYFEQLPRTAIIPFPVNARPGLQMRLYRLADNTPVADAVKRINTRAQEFNAHVFADANLFAGRVPVGITGDPWSDKGSPVPGEPITATQAFTSQWAFGDQGIGLMVASGRSVTLTGNGTRIGIFDTSPFTVPSGAEELRVVGDLTLTVAHPTFSASLPPPTPTLVISDHGLFVASLVHAVAPSATLKLVRVLDEYGQGTLFDLNYALSQFVTETLALGRPGVINLSLGVHPPPDAATTGLPDEIVALKTIIGGAAGFNFIVVAAAGNDSTPTSTMPLQIPASYPTAIGVAASTITRTKACFSNAGFDPSPGIYPRPWLAAPGGGCGSTLPDDYVIGRGLSSPSGYLYWKGTSFSAPLVSGIAALVLGRGNLTSGLVFSQTRGLLLRGAALCDHPGLGIGIANVWKTLDLAVTTPGSAYLCGDFDSNSKVTAGDIASAASHWNSWRGDSRYRALYDYDADRTINILDVMSWAQFFGNTWP